MYLTKVYNSTFKGTLSYKSGDGVALLAILAHLVSVMVLWDLYGLFSAKDLFIVLINLFLFRFAFWSWVYYVVSAIVILSSISAVCKVYASLQ